MAKMIKPKSVDSYVRSFPPDVQAVLRKLRQTIKAAAPQAEEVISYSMPSYKLNKTYLIYFAAWKNHVALYPAHLLMAAKIPGLKKYMVSKGTLKFPLDKPLPLGLIKKAVRFRVKQVMAKKKITFDKKIK